MTVQYFELLRFCDEEIAFTSRSVQLDWVVLRIVFTDDMSELHEPNLPLFMHAVCNKMVWHRRSRGT